MSLVAIGSAIVREKFLKSCFTLEHGLADHPLFALPRPVQLTQSLPRDRIEHNSSKVAVGARPEEVPKIDMNAAAAISSIKTANAWM